MDQSVKYESNCDTGNMATSDNASSHNTVVKNESSVNMPQSNSPNVAYLPQQSMAAMQQLLSPLQFLQAPSGATSSAGASLSWMMPPPYQMMMLPGSGMPQPLFLPSGGSGAGVFTMSDGQVFVTPIADATANGSVASDGTGNTPGQSPQYHGGLAVQPGTGNAAETSRQHRPPASTPGRRSVSDGPKPPKKPLTPYMIFSKMIWPRVKAEHAHLSSVCEIGAIVGSLWRELDAGQKQQYNELYVKDKERYDEELRNYLKENGMAASDLNKVKPKRSPSHRSTPARAQSQQPAWTNGAAGSQPAVGHQLTAGSSLPALYANHDGSVAINSNCAAGLPSSSYSDGAQAALAAAAVASSRSWNWNQASDGTMVYQLAAGTADAVTTCNGMPQPSNHFASRAGAGPGSSSDPSRVEQLEAEVVRLRSALADKTREAQQLQHDLSIARRAIDDQQTQSVGATASTTGGEFSSSSDVTAKPDAVPVSSAE